MSCALCACCWALLVDDRLCCAVVEGFVGVEVALDVERVVIEDLAGAGEEVLAEVEVAAGEGEEADVEVRLEGIMAVGRRCGM